MYSYSHFHFLLCQFGELCFPRNSSFSSNLSNLLAQSEHVQICGDAFLALFFSVGNVCFPFSFLPDQPAAFPKVPSGSALLS